MSRTDNTICVILRLVWIKTTLLKQGDISQNGYACASRNDESQARKAYFTVNKYTRVKI